MQQLKHNLADQIKKESTTQLTLSTKNSLQI